MISSNGSQKLNVLVVGAGMYTAGKGTSGYGTVMPALNELYREGLIDSVSVAATSSKSILGLQKKLGLLRKISGIGMRIEGFPRKGKDPKAYKKAISLSNPDCAIVVVPDHLHYGVAADLIRAGIHTLVVKPLTPTLKEARELVELAKKENVYCAVEFHKRYDEANLKLKDVIKENKIGGLLYISVEYSQRRIMPTKGFRNWVTKTNIFQYLGVHYVDIIYFATGAKPLRVLATGQKKLLKKYGFDTYDSIQAIIEWEGLKKDRFVSVILTNWIDPNTTSAMSDQKIKAIGTNGRFESDQKNRGVQIVTESEGIEDINPYFTQAYSSGRSRTIKAFKGYGIESIRQFCKDALKIKGGLNTPGDFEGSRPTFKEALISTAVIEAVNSSLKINSAWVGVKL